MTTKGEDTTPRFQGELAPARSTGDLISFLAGAIPLSKAGERHGDGITDVRIEGDEFSITLDPDQLEKTGCSILAASKRHPALFAHSEVTFDPRICS